MDIKQFRKSIINELKELKEKRIFEFNDKLNPKNSIDRKKAVLKNEEYKETYNIFCNNFFKNLSDSEDFKKNTKRLYDLELNVKDKRILSEEKELYFSNISKDLVDFFRERHGVEFFKDQFNFNLSVFYQNKTRKKEGQEAWDFTQEKLEKIKWGYVHYKAKYNAKDRTFTKYSSFISIVIKNRLIDYRKRKKIYFETLPEESSVPSHSPNTETELVNKDIVKQLLKELPPKKRRFIKLIYYLGYTQFQAGQKVFGDTKPYESTNRHTKLRKQLDLRATQLGYK